MLNKMKNVLAKITGASIVDEKLVMDIIKDIQRILIQSDVNVALVKQLSEEIKKKAIEEKPAPGISLKEHLIRIIYDELLEILGGEAYKPRMDKHKILLVGLYGSGKTTTAAKLAKFYSKRGFKTAMISTDTWRPAAFEQLKQLGKQAKIPVLGDMAPDPIEILKSAEKALKEYDIVIVDSAGRDNLNKSLIEEIKRIKEWLKPEETYLVISADIGQSASKQAMELNEALGLTGVIVTKADSSGKAGGALSACAVAKVPVTFIGTGEKLDDLELFNAERFISSLLGFPDIGSLVKKVREAVEESEFSAEDILKGDYNLKTFYKQLEATRKMGPLKKVFEMMGLSQMPEELVETGEKKLEVYKIIMDSMTREELEHPEIIKASRIKRIAKGSGRKEEEVRELLRQFENGRKMIKRFKKGKVRGLQNMMKHFKLPM
ncbi:signal recognition particle protein [Candidatus Micrarchaeota archaeon]|nr:MAG: signal recognition particle protein [Candidatus Micrarchaeota archaeon]